MTRDPHDPLATRRPFATRVWAAVTLAYGMLLLFTTHHPKPRDLLGDKPPSDKLLHFASYAILAALVAATLAASGRAALRPFLVAAAALAGFAALDELTQPLPWFRRSADPVDWLCDCAGIATGLLAGFALVRLRGRRTADRGS